MIVAAIGFEFAEDQLRDLFMISPAKRRAPIIVAAAQRVCMLSAVFCSEFSLNRISLL